MGNHGNLNSIGVPTMFLDHLGSHSILEFIVSWDMVEPVGTSDSRTRTVPWDDGTSRRGERKLGS